MPRIFDPYFTTKHQSQGTGLGLHMSFRIITESFKGKLTVQNSENGAKFLIYLPNLEA
jgi:signal transduction histidine kinase